MKTYYTKAEIQLMTPSEILELFNELYYGEMGPAMASLYQDKTIDWMLPQNEKDTLEEQLFQPYQVVGILGPENVTITAYKDIVTPFHKIRNLLEWLTPEQEQDEGVQLDFLTWLAGFDLGEELDYAHEDYWDGFYIHIRNLKAEGPSAMEDLLRGIFWDVSRDLGNPYTGELIVKKEYQLDPWTYQRQRYMVVANLRFLRSYFEDPEYGHQLLTNPDSFFEENLKDGNKGGPVITRAEIDQYKVVMDPEWFINLYKKAHHLYREGCTTFEEFRNHLDK